MTNYGPNDRDPRDGPNRGETLEGKVARETAEGAEEVETRDEGLGGAARPKQPSHVEPPRRSNKEGR